MRRDARSRPRRCKCQNRPGASLLAKRTLDPADGDGRSTPRSTTGPRGSKRPAMAGEPGEATRDPSPASRSRASVIDPLYGRSLASRVSVTRLSVVLLAALTLPALAAPAAAPSSLPAAARALPDPALLRNAAFVSVDVQEAPPRSYVTDETVPKLWKSMGITAPDVNAATDYTYDVAFPNAVRVADACRAAGLPMIFIHWGSLFHDGMDLDPAVRAEFIGQHGLDYRKWGHSLGDPYARPASFFKIRPGEYVIPKAAQDAFTSSNLLNVLRNLGVKTILFVGGHTGACLGRTADSARKNGFRMICVEDATFDARQSTRRAFIDQTGYDAVLTTAELEQWLKSAPAR